MVKADKKHRAGEYKGQRKAVFKRKQADRLRHCREVQKDKQSYEQ